MKKIIMLGLLLAVHAIVFAQGGGPVPDPEPITAAPVDGGVSLLAAAGIAYGAKKLWDKRKEQNREE